MNVKLFLNSNLYFQKRQLISNINKFPFDVEFMTLFKIWKLKIGFYEQRNRVFFLRYKNNILFVNSFVKIGNIRMLKDFILAKIDEFLVVRLVLSSFDQNDDLQYAVEPVHIAKIDLSSPRPKF